MNFHLLNNSPWAQHMRMLNDPNTFYFDLDPVMKSSECACSKKYYQWQWRSPPEWISSKIPDKQLRKELNYINELCEQNTPSKTLYFWIGPLLVAFGIFGNYMFYATLFNPDGASTARMYTWLGIGILSLMLGIIIWTNVPANITYKAAEEGRKVVDTYIEKMNKKYENQKLIFSMEQGMYRYAWSRKYWWKRNDIKIMIKPDDWQPANNNNFVNPQIIVQSGNMIPNNYNSFGPAIVPNNENNEGIDDNNENENKFCIKCGNGIIGMNFCAKCGAKVGNNVETYQ